MSELKALPGRVILRFPPPVEKSTGGIVIPQTSQLRPELGEIVDVGEARDENERRARAALLDIQAANGRVAVSFASGVSYWRDYERQSMDEREWGFLKHVKAYNLTELAAYVSE